MYQLEFGVRRVRCALPTLTCPDTQSVKLRLPFSKPAEDRKGIKEAIVEMTKAAAAAAK